jgi:hypothetical protein
MTETTNYRYDVFISYSHKDKVWVRNILLPTLENNKIKVAIDFRDFEPGAPSIMEMERVVKESRKVLLVLTPNYLNSAWSEFESTMISTLDPGARQRRILPILLQKCDIPLRINHITYVDFTDPTMSRLQWENLIIAINKTISKISIGKQNLDERSIAGLSSSIHSRLRNILVDCEHLSSTDRVRAMFNDPRLTPYRSGIPEGTNIAERVDLLIDFLTNRKLRSGENLLIIFLVNLQNNIPNTDEKYERLTKVISDIEISLTVNNQHPD